MKLSKKQVGAAYETYLHAYAHVAGFAEPSAVSGSSKSFVRESGLEHSFAVAQAVRDKTNGCLRGLIEFEGELREALDAPAKERPPADGDATPPGSED